jgi:hypothetical protein
MSSANPLKAYAGEQLRSACWDDHLTTCSRVLHAAISPHPQAPQQLISSQQPSAVGLTPQEPLDSFCEFPAINPSHRSQAYRYAYCLSAVRPTNIGNALSKMDLQQGSAQTWHEPGGAVGEAIRFYWNCSILDAVSEGRLTCTWHKLGGAEGEGGAAGEAVMSPISKDCSQSRCSMWLRGPADGTIRAQSLMTTNIENSNG